MPDDTPHFDNAGRLIAPQYDDVYFSAEDGLAETRHVFLEGNRLAERFAAMMPGEAFTIGETGFGTGLNFLATWQLFEQHAPADTRLSFFSIEGYPLDAATVGRALSPWPELSPYREALLQQWGPLWRGTHYFRFANGRVRLSLSVDEITKPRASMRVAPVNAWFLDGFAPSRNPAMWNAQVFEMVWAGSASDATLATYTAAGHVRRGLIEAGFDIEKRPGFGMKRDMTVGWLEAPKVNTRPMPRALVIGASLAGSFTARALAEIGVAVTVIEKQQLHRGELPSLAPRQAVLQPKISDAGHEPGSQLREAYALIERMLSSDRAFAERAGWRRCGAFHAAVDTRTERRLRRFVDQFGPSGLCRWVEPPQTLDEAGVLLPVGGVAIDRAGVLRPAGLCMALLDHPLIKLRDGLEMTDLISTSTGWAAACHNEIIEAEVAVVANAINAARIPILASYSPSPVRGQATLLSAPDQPGQLASIKRAVFYGGYITPLIDGVQTLGASFVNGDRSLQWRDEEHTHVCDKLARLLPAEAARLHKITDAKGWVGLRSVNGFVGETEEKLYVSLGHGSHGIASAANAAEHIAHHVMANVLLA
ncbi:MAG: tRNA (5-methylaminomethyl-2-thiouridine)(34)-methyltransferase MnmD [Planctomycetota bacterium]